MLTVLATLGPHRLDAGRCTVASRFRCRSFDRRYVVGALSTGRCLPAVAPSLSVFCGIPASKIAALEIRNAFVGHRPEWFFARQTTPYRTHLNPSFCLPCLAEQIRGGCPLHVQAAWAVPILTHCPSHLVALQALCPSCWIHDPVDWLAAQKHRIILCKRCSISPGVGQARPPEIPQSGLEGCRPLPCAPDPPKSCRRFVLSSMPNHRPQRLAADLRRCPHP